MWSHGVADITMISALLMAAEFGTRVIHMITLMSLCWSFVGRRPNATISRPHCDGTVWDINFTCAEFGPKCMHILVIQHLTVSDTKSYLYGKYNVSVLKTLRAGDFSTFPPPLESVMNRVNSGRPVVPSELRSAILQHGPCRLKGPLPIGSENGNRRIFSENTTFTLDKPVGCSAAIGNAKRVGHRCVGQPEELRSEDHIT